MAVNHHVAGSSPARGATFKPSAAKWLQRAARLANHQDIRLKSRQARIGSVMKHYSLKIMVAFFSSSSSASTTAFSMFIAGSYLTVGLVERPRTRTTTC